MECASPLALSDAGRAFDPPLVFLRAAALRSRFPLQRFNLKTAVETTDGHRFTQIEKAMGNSTGLERFHLLGDL